MTLETEVRRSGLWILAAAGEKLHLVSSLKADLEGFGLNYSSYYESVSTISIYSSRLRPPRSLLWLRLYHNPQCGAQQYRKEKENATFRAAF